MLQFNPPQFLPLCAVVAQTNPPSVLGGPSLSLAGMIARGEFCGALALRGRSADTREGAVLLATAHALYQGQLRFDEHGRLTIPDRDDEDTRPSNLLFDNRALRMAFGGIDKVPAEVERLAVAVQDYQVVTVKLI